MVRSRAHRCSESRTGTARVGHVSPVMMPNPIAHLLHESHISRGQGFTPQDAVFHIQGVSARPLPLAVLQNPRHRPYAPWFEYVPSEGASGPSCTLRRSNSKIAVVHFRFSSASYFYRRHNINSVVVRPCNKAAIFLHCCGQPTRKHSR